jgi:hypothetical protein
MRSLLAVVGVLAVLGLNAEGQESKGKAAPTADAIINLVGARISKVFAQLGTPEDLHTWRGSTPEEDNVVLDYGTFVVYVHHKTANSCLFRSEWKGKVKGIKFGDDQKQAVGALGSEHETYKSEDGTQAYVWDLKEIDSSLTVQFDKNNKVAGLMIVLK